MNRKERRKALIAEARTIGEKAETEGRDLTDNEMVRVSAIKSEVNTLSAQIKTDDEARNALKMIGNDDGGEGGSGPNTKAVAPGGGPSSASAKAIMAEVRERATDGNFKAVTVNGGSVTVPVGQGVGTMAQSNYLISQLVRMIPSDGVDGDAVSYLRQVGRTLAAATVARGAEKPNSSLEWEGVNDAYATVAHLAEVPNQYLESFAKFSQVIEWEMLYGMALGLDDLLLNGGTDENGEVMAGILGTTGVKRTPFATNKLLTLRRAVGAIQREGTQPTAIVLHPDDWEEIETQTIVDGSYLLDGVPTNAGEPRLWNVPVQLAPSVGVGTSVVGAFSDPNIGLANRGGIKLQWNPFKLDHLNKTVLRVEGRFVPVIARPASFAVANLTAA